MPATRVKSIAMALDIAGLRAIDIATQVTEAQGANCVRAHLTPGTSKSWMLDATIAAMSPLSRWQHSAVCLLSSLLVSAV
jgi:hypothetical protein